MSEPLNLVSNAAFLIAAFQASKFLRNNDLHQLLGMRVLIALLYSVGIGSALFHSFAQKWAEIADVIPILCFVLWFLFLWSKKVLKHSRLGTARFFTGFALISLLMVLITMGMDFGGSQFYFGILVFVAGLAWHQFFNLKALPWLASTFLLFLLSLTFRSIDMKICSYAPIGSHFLWHLGNALVCYTAIRALAGELLMNRPELQQISRPF